MSRYGGKGRSKGKPEGFGPLEGQFQAIFDDFFRRPAAGSGQDRRIPMLVSLEEAASGASKVIKATFEAHCTACKGSGVLHGDPYVTGCPVCVGKRHVLQERTLTVKVPAGIDDGQVLRLAGQGDEAPLGVGRAGDLMIEVIVAPHPCLRRAGVDLFVEVRIDAETARRGGRVKVPVLDGERWIRVSAGTVTGAEMRLAGFGAVRLGAEAVPIPAEVTAAPYRSRSVGDHRGDQIVTFVVGESIADENDDTFELRRATRNQGLGRTVALAAALVAALIGAFVLGR
ncbi:DnaJ C-terminal domain-containing protein [Polyangium mundeleinium]|uniref:DnaJ C-terminal domain-containing protein n=1 Tax=Polyangium mundeleinium TaxID=2995306 RepID=A0ABT5EKQ1_9BACT|nr:DnaJ C-terminal domain-containing protein [Polyangium mundeleinium]MDC0741296.1 DnaJ C-terminal domain-containing protein [Polyangium mundeleinium]